ncbi:MAG: ROK family protein [Thermoproteales archaeon]|nr:ROK family protein [Thermoproteales archaeon]
MYLIGVDVGATNIRVDLANEKGIFLAKITEKTVRKGSGIELTNQIADMVKRVIRETDVSMEDVKGIGIGTIGPLDLKRGVIVNPANLPFNEVPLRDPLEKEFNKPVYILNDAAAGVVGEQLYGVGKGVKNLVYVTISTGIGAGVFVDGNLLVGKDGNAHEVGHMVVDIEGKMVCGCGKRGHWEAYTSGTGIPKYAIFLIDKFPRKDVEDSLLYKLTGGDWEKLTAKMVYDAAKRGDEVALQIVEEVGRINAIGLANIVNVYDPSLIVLGGSVVLNNVELVLKPVKKYIGDYVVNRLPRIEVTRLGGDVGLYGAIGAVLLEMRLEPVE